MSPAHCPKKSASIYRPRRPEKTVLFETIKKHYRSWQSRSEQHIPKYIQDEFEGYLGCGILTNGFACAHCDSCNRDFLIGFSCKGRGICPSCNARAMAETAANLIENIIPCVPVRQFVISFPKRIRHYLQTHTILQTTLRIVVDEIRKKLIACSPDVPNPKIGAVSFFQNFGNTLNVHPHFHLVVADGVFSAEEDSLIFCESTLSFEDIADIEDCIRERVLRYFGRRGFFTKEEISTMLSYETSGFSLDAAVRVESWDRDGLERLVRYCARPPFKSENLRKNGLWLTYRFPKPTHTGQTSTNIEPLDFLEKISKFIPYPRRHRRRYHGVFAPNSPLRQKVAANAKKRPLSSIPPHQQEAATKTEKVSLNWAKLIARIYEVNPLICQCGKEIKITAFVTHSAEIRRILGKVDWPCETIEFDPPEDFTEWEICQLTPGTEDGFPADIPEFCGEKGPDPPFADYYVDPPHWEDIRDPPHWGD